jgi:HD-GYP domain-containing protein (c-di-GMP phosphodiesterase class II)
VLHHHEHYNGKGYPHGLEGESIPLLARIIAVADTFDAMSSNRSYRAALARERVLDEIERCGGTQFDPRISAMIRRIDLAGFDAMVARHASDLSTARAA